MIGDGPIHSWPASEQRPMSLCLFDERKQVVKQGRTSSLLPLYLHPMPPRKSEDSAERWRAATGNLQLKASAELSACSKSLSDSRSTSLQKLTLELSGCRRRRTILAQTDIGSPLERIVRLQRMRLSRCVRNTFKTLVQLAGSLDPMRKG
jgi:hypothetical protein